MKENIAKGRAVNSDAPAEPKGTAGGSSLLSLCGSGKSNTRSRKLAAIRSGLESGTYRVDSRQIAAKLMQRMSRPQLDPESRIGGSDGVFG